MKGIEDRIPIWANVRCSCDAERGRKMEHDPGQSKDGFRLLFKRHCNFSSEVGNATLSKEGTFQDPNIATKV